MNSIMIIYPDNNIRKCSDIKADDPFYTYLYDMIELSSTSYENIVSSEFHLYQFRNLKYNRFFMCF